MKPIHVRFRTNVCERLKWLSLASICLIILITVVVQAISLTGQWWVIEADNRPKYRGPILVFHSFSSPSTAHRFVFCRSTIAVFKTALVTFCGFVTKYYTTSRGVFASHPRHRPHCQWLTFRPEISHPAKRFIHFSIRGQTWILSYTFL